MKDMALIKRHPKYYLDIEQRRKSLMLLKVESLGGENWYDLLGYKDHYKISNFFRIKSLYRLVTRKDGAIIAKPEQLRKTSINSDGYIDIVLTKDGVSKTVGVHILMAKMFVPNPLNLPEVNHIDGDKLNCVAPNLEWGTHLHNMRHAVKSGLRRYQKGVNNGRYKIPPEKVIEIYASKLRSLELAKTYGVTRSCIQRIRNGRTYSEITNHGKSK